MSAIFGEKLNFTQGQGPDVELVVFGDEFYARYETPDGFTVVYDPDLDCYCYAILANGRFASSGAPISKSPPPGLRRHLKESAEARNEQFERRYGALRPPAPAAAGYVSLTLGRNHGLLEGDRVSAGDVRGLTILVDFTDTTTTVSAADLEAMLNGTHYTVNGNYCSVREYFQKVSCGNLNYTNRVVGPVRLSHSRAHYINTLLVEEALRAAVEQFNIDLHEFDSGNRGVIDALNIMYAGRTMYSGNLWPHNSTINLTIDGMHTNFYMLTSAGRHPADLSIGTFCHENGHMLCRFPDLYDYGTRDGDFENSQGIGFYCLMGAGNHLGEGRIPAPVCGYLRDLVGWCDREVLLNSPGVYEARHGDYGTLLKFETDKPNEYFIVENRTRMELDTDLPSTGLAVYHCDTLGSNEWQGGTPEKHYQCGLIQADGHLDLELNRNLGDETDMFREQSGVVLTHDGSPSSRQWDGSDSGLIISDIGAPGEVIRFRTGRLQISPRIRREIKADLLIPDNQPQGVDSMIEIMEAGQIASVQVGVDIQHTYIGDLRVVLVTPGGKRIALHEKTGGNKRDLRKTYDGQSTAALRSLAGESMQGRWTLHVEDLARRDVGRLNSWWVEIEYQAAGHMAHIEIAPHAAIPDNDVHGVDSAMAVQQSGVIREVTVRVDIVHPYIGDLQVELVSPTGTTVLLHDRQGGSRDNLHASYDRTVAPALAALSGQPMQGDWHLHVRDIQSRDVGTLEEWELDLEY